MKDRLSIHLENGQAGVREAVTILRNGGTASVSGLVGISNIEYSTTSQCGQVFIPKTILHVHSTGDSNIRFSSGPSKFRRSNIEIIGNGYDRASGLLITYDPELDNSYINGPGYGGYSDFCINPSGTDNPVADISLIRPSGSVGCEFSHITLSERGYVAIGLTRARNNTNTGYERRVFPNAPLTIAYSCDEHADSGTISMHEQSSGPVPTSNFGKIYVKPYTIGGKTQALYFKDDGGNETNLVLSEDLEPNDSLDGLIYGDQYGNTFGGWHCPSVRPVINPIAKTKNTLYGYGAGWGLARPGSSFGNTIIGYLTASGLSSPIENTIIGSENLSSILRANNNVVIGNNNLSFVQNPLSFDSYDGNILIGRNLYTNTAPQNGTFALGEGDTPLLLGNISSNRNLSIIDGYFSIVSLNDNQYKVSHSYDQQFSRNTIEITSKDNNKFGSNYCEDNLKFNFSNSDNLSFSLFELDPRGGPLSNNPIYQAPTVLRPFGKLDGDLKLRGAIRFSDGTSLSGISMFDFAPALASSGISKVFQNSNNSNYFVLNFSSLNLAGNISNNIRTDNTYIPVQLDGINSSLVGKMSLQGLTAYINSGTSVMSENCNVLISNPENKLLVNVGANAKSVMIGCDVAYGCSGQYNSIFIGSSAGANSTVPNPVLSTDYSNIFIGNHAGNHASNTSNVVFLGTNAGKNSDNSQNSIFIGSNAGLNTTYNESIGIGRHALRGSDNLSNEEGGIGNLEIVCGMLDNQRLMFEAGSLSNRLNIQNCIAGRSDYRNISIGDARLAPTAPFEVRYDDSVGHSNNPQIVNPKNSYKKVIQSWYFNDQLVAYLNSDGDLINNTSNQNSSFVEGKMLTYLGGGSFENTQSTGIMQIYEYKNVNEGSVPVPGKTITLTNRNSSLIRNIGDYVMAIKMGNEWRPIGRI